MGWHFLCGFHLLIHNWLVMRIHLGDMLMRRKKEAIKDLSMLYGLPPYDGGSNICLNDGYFANSLVRKYGMDLTRLAEVSGFNDLQAEWSKARSKFLRNA